MPEIIKLVSLSVKCISWSNAVEHALQIDKFECRLSNKPCPLGDHSKVAKFILSNSFQALTKVWRRIWPFSEPFKSPCGSARMTLERFRPSLYALCSGDSCCMTSKHREDIECIWNISAFMVSVALMNAQRQWWVCIPWVISVPNVVVAEKIRKYVLAKVSLLLAPCW